MDIEQLIEKYQLSESEVQVLQYMYSHRNGLRTIGIRELAEKTFTSSSFIVKMAKKLTLSGYSELVFLMTDTNNFENPFDNSLKISEYIEPFFNCIKAHQNSMIMILGNGYSQNLANYMSEYLNLHGFRSTSNSHLELLRAQDNGQNLLIVISNSGETIRLNELTNQAIRNDYDVLSFVGNKNSALGKLSTVTVSTNTFKVTSFEKNTPQLFFGMTLIYFEILMSKTINKLCEQKKRFPC